MDFRRFRGLIGLLVALGCNSANSSEGWDTSSSPTMTSGSGTTVSPSTESGTSQGSEASGETRTSGGQGRSTGSGTTDTTGGGSTMGTYEVAGPHPVGHITFTIPDLQRPLSVEVWYPAAGRAMAVAQAGVPITDFYPDEPRASAFADLVDGAPSPQ